MDEKFLSDFNSTLNSLENGNYLRTSIFTVKEVIDKVFEFSNFLNSLGRVSIMHAEQDECQILVPLFLFLKKNIKSAMCEIGQSSTKKIHNFICPECDELIQVPPNNDVWTYIQSHEHFEDIFSKFLDGTLVLSNSQNNSLNEPEPTPSTSKFVLEHRDSLDNEHTDSGIDYEDGLNGNCSQDEEEPLGSNSFRFNFRPKYDDVVESILYPDSYKGLTKFDQSKYNTVQKISHFKASCLLCCCDIQSNKRISKKQCLDHVIGQRHLRNAEIDANKAAVEAYHELFWNMETIYQAHQVYFEPKSRSSLRCVLCNAHVTDKTIISHIQGDKHKHFVIKMYQEDSPDYFLLNVQVGAYGIEDKKPETDKNKPETSEARGSDRRERRSTLRDGGPVEHNIVRSVQNMDNNTLQCFIPLRFKEHMKCFKDNETYIRCNVCQSNIRREVDEVRKHIISNMHLQQSKMQTPKYTYFCEICNRKFNDEHAWENHFKEGRNRHSRISKSRVNNLCEYECTTCKTVIYGDEVSLTRHRNKTGARRERREKPKDLKLPQEVQRLFLTREVVEKEGDWLMRQANNNGNCLEKTLECCKRLEAVLATSIDQCKAYPFGSRMSGLGNQDSDLDMFIDMGDMYLGRQKQDAPAQCHIVKQVANILSKHKDEFAKIQQVIAARTPIVKVKHLATGLECDLSFRHGLSVENTKFLKICLDMQPIAQPFILILKKWSGFNKFTDNISTYGLAMLAIFYLQGEGYLLSVKQLKELNPSAAPVISGWETIKYTMPLESMKNQVRQYEHSVVRLLKDFFDYYATFGYEEDVVCPLLGHTIKKNLFHDPNKLPKEMAAYVKQLKGKEPEAFRYTSPFCIQDPFDLCHNLTKACPGNILAMFKKLCELSSKHLASMK